MTNEPPTPEELYKDYIEDNLSKQAIAEKYHISKKRVRFFLELYGILQISSYEKRSITYQRLYGVENNSQLPDFKNKLESTCLNRYGFKTAILNPEVKEKKENTCRNRYGVSSYSKTSEYKLRVKKTCIQNMELVLFNSVI